MDAIYYGVKKRFANDNRVMVHRKSSREAAAAFPDGTFDWVYIDGDHSYDAVFNDLVSWKPKSRRGGVLAGDDLNWRDENGSLSVRFAVTSFVKAEGLNVEILPQGQFMIKL